MFDGFVVVFWDYVEQGWFGFIVFEVFGGQVLDDLIFCVMFEIFFGVNYSL